MFTGALALQLMLHMPGAADNAAAGGDGAVGAERGGSPCQNNRHVENNQVLPTTPLPAEMGQWAWSGAGLRAKTFFHSDSQICSVNNPNQRARSSDGRSKGECFAPPALHGKACSKYL